MSGTDHTVFTDLRAEGDQIAHLTWVDGYARLAATDPEQFFPTPRGAGTR